MNSSIEPKLAAPGAGIPFFERMLSNAGLRFLATVKSRQLLQQQFDEEEWRLRALAGGLSDEEGRQQMLISRIAGLEDSSRYWSPWMVLQHLVIVNGAITGIIPALAAGRTGLPAASTAGVKPVQTAGPEMKAMFDKVNERYRRTVDSIADLKTAAKHPHPWFGPLDAHGWHALAAVHMAIHRRQLALIVEALRKRR